MKIRESGENYLETIYTIKQKKDEVRSVDVAQALGFSKPSISRAMGILKQEGFIEIDESGLISFTAEGFRQAESVYIRHGVITDFFVKVLNVQPETADFDACRIEHVISEETIRSMREFLKSR